MKGFLRTKFGRWLFPLAACVDDALHPPICVETGEPKWPGNCWNVRCRLGKTCCRAAGVALGAKPGRVLLESDAFCPSCGHNRHTSSVSSVDLGDGRKGCQFCAQEWDELPARGSRA